MFNFFLFFFFKADFEISANPRPGERKNTNKKIRKGLNLVCKILLVFIAPLLSVSQVGFAVINGTSNTSGISKS